MYCECNLRVPISALSIEGSKSIDFDVNDGLHSTVSATVWTHRKSVTRLQSHSYQILVIFFNRRRNLNLSQIKSCFFFMKWKAKTAKLSSWPWILFLYLMTNNHMDWMVHQIESIPSKNTFRFAVPNYTPNMVYPLFYGQKFIILISFSLCKKCWLFVEYFEVVSECERVCVVKSLTTARERHAFENAECTWWWW